MLNTARQLQAAAAAAAADLALRAGRFAQAGLSESLRVGLAPLQEDNAHRQIAVEAAWWYAYAAHLQMLRAAGAAPRLAALVYLNHLDLERGPVRVPASPRAAQAPPAATPAPARASAGAGAGAAAPTPRPAKAARKPSA